MIIAKDKDGVIVNLRNFLYCNKVTVNSLKKPDSRYLKDSVQVDLYGILKAREMILPMTETEYNNEVSTKLTKWKKENVATTQWEVTFKDFSYYFLKNPFDI